MESDAPPEEGVGATCRSVIRTGPRKDGSRLPDRICGRPCVPKLDVCAYHSPRTRALARAARIHGHEMAAAQRRARAVESARLEGGLQASGVDVATSAGLYALLDDEIARVRAKEERSPHDDRHLATCLKLALDLREAFARDEDVEETQARVELVEARIRRMADPRAAAVLDLVDEVPEGAIKIEEES